MTARRRVAFIEKMIELLDDFVFEPNAWDFAVAIGIGVDPDADRAALDELADAMLVWAEGPELERLTDEALEGLWDDELAGWIREGLVSLADQDDWRDAASAALLEFDRDPRRAEVSREVIRHLAMELGSADHPPLFCLSCIDEEIGDAQPEDRRALGVRVAILAGRNAAIPDAELREALIGAASRSPLERLGTRGRREAVRARLGRLAAFGRESMPLLAAQLQAIAVEPLPERAEDDDVWREVCTWLLGGAARPELN